MGDVYSIAHLYKTDSNERRPCSELQDIDIEEWRSKSY